MLNQSKKKKTQKEPWYAREAEGSIKMEAFLEQRSLQWHGVNPQAAGLDLYKHTGGKVNGGSKATAI